jgi:ATP-dependent phosphofructokinase / diphosphate-dependent phosphofructokinase
MRHGIEGLIAGDLVDLSRETPAQLNRLRRTPSAALGSCRHKLTDDDIEVILGRLRDLQVDVFLYAGGNDSADTTHRLGMAAHDAGLTTRFLGLPKTIDNDLPEMDHCPGFGSAARFVAVATQEIGTDTVAMARTDPIRFVEVMGRDAGWLAASSALGRSNPDDAPHLVLLPESPLSVDEVLGRIREIQLALGHAVVVLCENQPGPDGEVLGSEAGPEFVDSFGHAYNASPSTYLARRVQKDLGLRARVDPLSRLQRASIALRSEVDAEEAEALGRAAVPLALGGETDQMLTLQRISNSPYRYEIGRTLIERIANRQRLLPPQYLASDGSGPSDAYVQWLRPLVGGRMPRHRDLRKPAIKEPLQRWSGSLIQAIWNGKAYCRPIFDLSSASWASTSDSDSSFLKRSSTSSVSS